MIENYYIYGRNISVKRDDMFSIGSDSPPFSKMRGVFKRLHKLKNEGLQTIGYVESNISMAGWGLAYACKVIGLQCIIYNPIYTKKKYKGWEIHKYHLEKWKEFGAIIIELPARMVKVNFYIAKKHLQDNYTNSILLPLGLPFEETIQEISEELKKIDTCLYDNIVVCVGSGTICAGLLRSLPNNKKLYGILSREGDLAERFKIILKKSGLNELFYNNNLILYNSGYSYSEKSKFEELFPSHPYYDLKAWEWLVKNINNVHGKILFWNIGRSVL